MKKYLMACVLAIFVTVPAFADPETPTGAYIGDLIAVGDTSEEGGCSGSVFANATQENPVQMTATFVPLCLTGQYLKVDDNAPSSGVLGTDYAIIGEKYVYCATCEPGHACDGVDASSDLVMTESGYLQTSGLGAICSTGTRAVNGVCTPCGLGTFGELDTNDLPTCTSCGSDTYTDETGLTQCKSCPADWPTNNNATGSQSVTDCYAVCETPVCVAGAQNCTFDSNYVSNNTAVYGTYCSSTFNGCVDGYEQKSLGQAITTNNINTMTHSGTTWSISLTNAPLTSVQGVYFCEAYDNDEDQTTPDVYGCFRKATAAYERTTKIPVNGTPVLVGIAAQSTEQACVAACNSSVGNNYTDNTSALALLNAANMDVCDPKTVNIAWDGVTNAGEAGTCVYDSQFTAPTSEAAANIVQVLVNAGKMPEYCGENHDQCTFLGWKILDESSSDNGENTGE